MTRKITFLSVIILVLVLSLSGSVNAASYSFILDRMVANVFIDQNGVMSIDYTFDFSNDPGASPIDYVDVGMPNTSYDMGSIDATVNGAPITDISKSTYVSGVALGLGSNEILPGQSGRVVMHVGVINRIIYPGQKQAYASFQFEPNYFDSSLVHGATDATITFHLPPGVTPDESVYYPASSNWPGNSAPDATLDENNRVTYTWHATNADGSSKYVFGGGFPDKYIPAAAIVRFSLSDWISENSDTLMTVGCFGGFGLFFVLIIVFSAISSNKRKLQYLPPKVSIEGHGIKRGLTAVEAAILMQEPLDKVMTMILFGVIKKGAATVVTKDPLKLQVTSPLPEGLNDYETDFLTAFGAERRDAQRLKLQDMMVTLVKSISEKMKGFSLKETVAYYKDIINRAWVQVETAGTPEVKSEAFDKYMEWTMMDKNYADRTRTTFGRGPVVVPMWWGSYDPVYRSSSSGASLPSIGKTTGTPSISLPHLPGSDFAASVVNSTQTFAGGVVGDIQSFTSGITNKTNPVPVSTSSGGGHSSGGGGGHSCACACACAGCACACAGGGR
jgi:hypothetical protein